MDPDHTTNILVFGAQECEQVQEEGGLVVFYYVMVMYVIQIVVCGGRKLA